MLERRSLLEEGGDVEDRVKETQQLSVEKKKYLEKRTRVDPHRHTSLIVRDGGEGGVSFSREFRGSASEGKSGGIQECGRRVGNWVQPPAP